MYPVQSLRLLLFVTALLINPSPAAPETPPPAENHVQLASPEKPRVRVVYLVSRDREERPEYTRALKHAILDLQTWYANQLDGLTFRLHHPIVEVVKSEQPAAWFSGHANGTNKDDWGFNNTLQEAHRLLGARQSDPKWVWILYSDGPGNTGRGGSGVACLPEDDLLGLVGKHPTQKDPLRWIAGLGHELGHAFGLPHPADPAKHADALMWTGIYGKYPDRTYLTPEDKKILRRSPFFFQPDGQPAFQPGAPLARHTYSGGRLEKYREGESTIWIESKSDDGPRYFFEDRPGQETEILMEDPSRGLSIRFPKKGGQAELSSDGGTTWHPFHKVSENLLEQR